MPNTGYPDNDDSRALTGQHDLGRQRVSCWSVEENIMEASVQAVADFNPGPLINVRTDSFGPDQRVPWVGLIDGCASAGTAAYPPKPEDPNSRD